MVIGPEPKARGSSLKIEIALHSFFNGVVKLEIGFFV
jgi:hypothetical protein